MKAWRLLRWGPIFAPRSNRSSSSKTLKRIPFHRQKYRLGLDMISLKTGPIDGTAIARCKPF